MISFSLPGAFIFAFLPVRSGGEAKTKQKIQG
jgi:hypothetical protein